MAVLVTDPDVGEELIAARRASGADRFDEVWEGLYVMAPLANDEHQEIQGGLFAAFLDAVGRNGEGLVRPGVNVSDREEDWQENYRCPDVVVFLKGTAARNRDTHWLGGPDFAVEILSPGDRTPEKMPFYASVNVRELLIVNRYPWSLELHRLKNEQFSLAGRVTPGGGEIIESRVLPLNFRLLAGERPKIEVTHRETKQNWLV